MNKQRLLIIEDNDDDAKLAVESLQECGEEFEFTHVFSFRQGLLELENSPPGSYQKIYLDLSLPDIYNRPHQALDALYHYVGKNDVIVVSGSQDSKLIRKVEEKGTQFLTKSEAFNSDSNALASFMFGLRLEKDRSVERHRDLANLEIKFIKLEQVVERNKSEINLLLSRFKEEDERVVNTLSSFQKRLETLEQNLIERIESLEEKSAFKLKSFEVRWQLLVVIVGAIAAAILPKLIEALTKR